MNELRKKFEALPDVRRKLRCLIKWCPDNECYVCKGVWIDEFYAIKLSWLNGAWYAFQEQQKKIDAALEFTCDVHSENWQESMHCIQELLK